MAGRLRTPLPKISMRRGVKPRAGDLPENPDEAPGQHGADGHMSEAVGGNPSDHGFANEMGTSPFGHGPDFSWTAECEDDIYKDKEVFVIDGPDIPRNAAGARVFWNELKSSKSSIDRSEDDLLLKWVDVSLSMLGDIRDVINKLDANSQGLLRLDRHLGKVVYQKGKSHPSFAVRIASYVELCHNCNRSPKGRVFLATMAQRFRRDRQRRRAISVLHLLKIELGSYKVSEVQAFVNRVRHVLVNLRQDDLKDKQLLFDWLFKKVKNRPAIAHEMRTIRKSQEGSRKRTWGYLWGAINSYLEHHYEDANQQSLQDAMDNNIHDAAVGPGERGKKRKSEKTDQEAAVSYPGNQSRAADQGTSSNPPGKVAGAYAAEGDGKYSSGRNPKGSHKGNASRERTPGLKAHTGWRYFAAGSCNKGTGCEYSHLAKDVRTLLEKQGGE